MVHCLRTKNIKTTKQGHEDAIKNLKLLDKMKEEEHLLCKGAQ